MPDRTGVQVRRVVAVALLIAAARSANGQNYERYKPLQLGPSLQNQGDLAVDTPLPEPVLDDRVLVESLDAVVIVDSSDKIDTSVAIDELRGIHYRFDAPGSLVRELAFQSIVQNKIGQPITLRAINELNRDIIKLYQRCKQPIVDVLIPEQRITSGTLHIVVIESRIGEVRIQPGCHFDAGETSRWIQCTRRGSRIYEPWIESDLFWMNQSPFRQVGVDLKKGAWPGTTDVVYQVNDMFPLRGYIGFDDSGVETLNFGRFFAGFQYGNFLGRGGTLGYQYTTDEDFHLLHAHSLSWNQPINRRYSLQIYGSFASVSPLLGFGLTQNGESWQIGSTLTRHLIRNRHRQRNFAFGLDFKSTNNNLEFDGTAISDSVADLFELRFGFDDFYRMDIDQYRSCSFTTSIGPGGGMTADNSTSAFNTLRPGSSPDFIYALARYDRADVVASRWLLTSRLTGQISSERLLFSETLGLGGFDTIRGTDQRELNADHGWIANFEFGPKTHRWGCRKNPRSLRSYWFVDMGTGYIDNAQPGEIDSDFVMSTGVGTYLQISDQFTFRFDYGFGVEPVAGPGRDDRAHIGLTWIPGPRL